MLGRWVSDLEVGDILPVVDYEVTPFLGLDYAHAVESVWERFHSAVEATPSWLRPRWPMSTSCAYWPQLVRRVQDPSPACSSNTMQPIMARSRWAAACR